MDSMTPRQSWAIFTISGYDVRDTEITKSQASEIISLLKNDLDSADNILAAIEKIESAGGVKKKEATPEKQDWPTLFTKAHRAGMQAAEAKVPQPMTVVERANPLDDSSEIVKSYGPYADGVCGFAWINIKPGNHSFCNWYKKNIDPDARDSYYGGISVWVHEFNQSYEKKAAYAGAFADVLNSEIDHPKFRAMAMSRLD